jgi:hypothetical protein
VTGFLEADESSSISCTGGFVSLIITLTLPRIGNSAVVSRGDGGSISPLWCFSTRRPSHPSNAFKSLALANSMPFERVLEAVMKQGFLKLTQRVIAPLAIVVAMAFSPVGAFAQNRAGGHAGGRQGGFNGGRSFSAPSRGNFNAGHGFSAPNRGNFSGSFNHGDSYRGRENYSDHHFDGDRGARFGGYYRPGFGVGVYAPYGYAAPVCNPAGFYDQYGNWQYYPGCAVPYGY